MFVLRVQFVDDSYSFMNVYIVVRLLVFLDDYRFRRQTVNLRVRKVV